MNDDLISRKELYAAIVELANNADCNIAILPEVASLVRYAPAINAVPVQHGQWDLFGYEYAGTPDTGYICSECGAQEYIESKYCPNCGANMDLEDEK